MFGLMSGVLSSRTGDGATDWQKPMANHLLTEGAAATQQPMRSDWQALASMLQMGLGAYLSQPGKPSTPGVAPGKMEPLTGRITGGGI